MSIANYFTLTRILISPIFLLVYAQYDALNIHITLLPYILLFLLSLSELSDACDGYFARKYNEVTDLGKILDPMADSIHRISVFLTFTLPPINLPMILIFILLYRDLVISTLRTICALKGFALAARFSGKLKAVIQALAAFIILVLLIPFSLGYMAETTLHKTCTIVATLASLYTLLSGLDYLIANRSYIVKMLANDKDNAFSPIE